MSESNSEIPNPEIPNPEIPNPLSLLEIFCMFQDPNIEGLPKKDV